LREAGGQANQTADNGSALDTVTDKSANELWSDTDFQRASNGRA
jgi:hypothetical protein